MENIFTEEMLTTLYRRACQYAVANWGKGEPDRLELESYGSFKAVWGNSCRGEYYETEEIIFPHNLTADLDQVYKERKEREELERQQRERERKEKERLDTERKQAQRYQEYLKLQQEFGNKQVQ